MNPGPTRSGWADGGAPTVVLSAAASLTVSVITVTVLPVWEMRICEPPGRAGGRHEWQVS